MNGEVARELGRKVGTDLLTKRAAAAYTEIFEKIASELGKRAGLSIAEVRGLVKNAEGEWWKRMLAGGGAGAAAGGGIGSLFGGVGAIPGALIGGGVGALGGLFGGRKKPPAGAGPGGMGGAKSTGELWGPAASRSFARMGMEPGRYQQRSSALRDFASGQQMQNRLAKEWSRLAAQQLF